MSTLSSTTGREVAAGTLWMTKGENTKKRVRVAARCGTSDCTYQGQLNIYDESTLGMGSINISEPSRVITLAHISEVSSLNSTHPTLAAGDSTKHNSLMFPMSLDNNMYSSHESMWGFMLLLQTGEAVELFADTREQQQLWIKYLHLMSMFPFSPIPEEPRVNPIRNSYRNKLKVSNFDADSVWPVYILSEEVGSRIHALGVHIVCLQSALSQQKPARMTIISPLDMEPIVMWEANRMRRTGSLGNLIFIEIGRRCEGGPGLIWMYASPEDSLSFRETVTRFLFNGDARSVAAKPNPSYHYDEVTTTVTATISRSPSTSPCSSGSSSFQLSFSAPAQTIKKEKATYDSVDISEYDYAYNSAPARSNSLPSNDAYGHISKPAVNSLPLNDSPPPINLQTHPSRKLQHHRSLSNPGSTTPSPSHHKFHPELSTGPLKNCHGGSNDSGVSGIAVSTSTLEEDFQEIDKSLNDILSDLSISPPPSKANDSPETHNGLDDIINQLEEFAKSDDDNLKTPVTRSNTLPSGQQPQNKSRRTNSTSTCQPTHYLTHKKAKSTLEHNEYVVMKPIGGSQTATQSKPPRQSYDFLELQLSPIKEASTSTSGDYENYPQPEEVAKATPTNYVTPYENILSNVTDDNDDDIYENTEPTPLKDKKVGALITSTLSELDNLQAVLNQLST